MRQRHSRVAGSILLLVVAAIVFGGLTGCAASATGSGQAPSPSPSPTVALPQGVPLPDVVEVVRTGPLNPPDNPPPPISRTVDDAAMVQRLYRTLYASPSLEWAHTYSCPADGGIDIRLTFSHQGMQVLTARLHASGCTYLQFGSQPPQARRGVTDALITLLATTMGVSRQVLLPPDGWCLCQ